MEASQDAHQGVGPVPIARSHPAAVVRELRARRARGLLDARLERGRDAADVLETGALRARETP